MLPMILMKKIISLVVFTSLILSLGAVYHRIGGWLQVAYPDAYYSGPVAVKDSLAAITSSIGVHLLDVSDPANPTQRAILGGFYHWMSEDLYFQGDYLYVLNYQYLSIVDVRIPEQAVTLSHFHLPNDGYQVVVSDSLAFIANDNYGMYIVDVSVPQTPFLAGAINSVTDVLGLAVVGNLAYLACYENGLQIIDVSVPQNPVLVGSLDTPGYAYGVAVQNNVAYLADWTSLRAIDVSDPANPVLLGAIDTPGSANDVEVSGTTAWVADHEFGICGVDIGDPASMAYLASYDTQSFCREVAVSGGHVFTEDFYSGLIVLDVSDPYGNGHAAAPSVTIPASMVSLDGDLAYVGNGIGQPAFSIYDVVNHRPPLLLGSVTDVYQSNCVRVRNDIAYCASGPAGLRIYDVSDPAAPTPLGFINSYPSSARWIMVEGDLAYLYGRDMGLWIVNIADPSAPSLLGSYASPSGWYDYQFAKVGNLICVPLENHGLRLFDVSNPASPDIAGFILIDPEIKSVAALGNILYAACGAGGLQVLDLANPVLPVVVNSVVPHGTSSVECVVVHDGLLYVADNGWNEITVFDLSDPAVPLEIDRFSWNLLTSHFAVRDNLLYTANDRFGLNVLNLGAVAADDPQAPPSVVQLTNYPNPFRPGASLHLELRSDLRGQASLRVYNLRGQAVRELEMSVSGAGVYDLPWDGCDERGQSLPGGVYCYRLTLGGQILTGRLTLLR